MSRFGSRALLEGGQVVVVADVVEIETGLFLGRKIDRTIDRPGRQIIMAYIVKLAQVRLDRPGIEPIHPPAVAVDHGLDPVEGAKNIRSIADADEALCAI